MRADLVPQRTRRIRFALLAAIWLNASTGAQAESFLFGENANGVTGQTAASLDSGPFRLELAADPPGAVLDEQDDEGLGIDTSSLMDVSDGGGTGDPRKFNLIDGNSPVSGQGESVEFSFQRRGILKDLLFDGMKDETLEYFSIAFPDASIITFFDFEAEFRLNQQSFQLAELGVANPTLAADASDDLIGVNYHFEAGEEFQITYGEIDYRNVLPGYEPLGSQKFGNGARLEGIVVVVPEPACVTLSLVCLFLVSAVINHGGRRSLSPRRRSSG